MLICDNTGASFTGLTVTVTVAANEVSSPSVTRYVKVVLPLKSSSGVKVAEEPVISTNPSEESWPIKYTKSSLSISEPIKSIVTDTSSSVVPEVSEATGASFTGLTVMITSCVSIKSPSLTINIKESFPLKFVVGI